MDDSILEHYAEGVELDRMAGPSSRIEFARTKELLERFLPPAPALVLDVGGGPGVYAAWLVEQGYRVHLVDPVPLHVEQAHTRGGFTAELGDARNLTCEDESFDAVLLLGPVYHLPDGADRLRALSEATRVVRPSGVVAVAAISRFASLLDGLLTGDLADPAFRAIVEGDLADGRHRNPDGRVEWFTTAFFHHPDELRAELVESGLELEGVFGIEGPGWLVSHLWDDPRGRENILTAARAIEQEPTLLGLSAHLLAVARPG